MKFGVRRYFLLSIVACMAACGSKVDLMANISEADANEVLAALSNAGIVATKVSGKEGLVAVRTEADAVGRAVDLLRSKGLPRERYAGMGDVFKKEGLISSPTEERARYIYALTQELRGTIALIDGVLAARVHVVLPERGVAGDTALPSSAAVFVKYQEGYYVAAVQPQIRKLVVNSIPGLTPDKVSIVLVAAQAPPKLDDQGGREATANPQGMGALQVFMILLLVAGALGASGFLAWKHWWVAQRGNRQPSQRDGA